MGGPCKVGIENSNSKENLTANEAVGCGFEPKGIEQIGDTKKSSTLANDKSFGAWRSLPWAKSRWIWVVPTLLLFFMFIMFLWQVALKKNTNATPAERTEEDCNAPQHDFD